METMMFSNLPGGLFHDDRTPFIHIRLPDLFPSELRVDMGHTSP